jgi:hypothetical protein
MANPLLPREKRHEDGKWGSEFPVISHALLIFGPKLTLLTAVEVGAWRPSFNGGSALRKEEKWLARWHIRGRTCTLFGGVLTSINGVFSYLKPVGKVT